MQLRPLVAILGILLLSAGSAWAAEDADKSKDKQPEKKPAAEAEKDGDKKDADKKDGDKKGESGKKDSDKRKGKGRKGKKDADAKKDESQKPDDTKPVDNPDKDFAPDQSKIPTPPPKDAVVLFDGKGTNLFLNKEGGEVNWPIEDGAITSSKEKWRANHIVSKLHFRDAHIHVEFLLSEKGSGNSGVYIHGNYELQVIYTPVDREKLGKGDAGSIYGFSTALVNAARPRDQWQVYDILYRAPRRDENEKIVEKGSITAWLNGKKVQDFFRFEEPRSTYHPYRYHTTDYLREIWSRQKKTSVGPVFLQDHQNPTRFRNVWILPLDDKAFMYE